MSAFTDLGDAMTALATALDGYVTFTDSLFAQLQTALANQTPADALAAVQAATATALAEKAKIDADIAKDVLPPSGSAAPKG